MATTKVRKPVDFARDVNIEITDPKIVQVFITVFREMAYSAMNESEYEYAEELIHVSNELNDARNILLDMIASERDQTKTEVA